MKTVLTRSTEHSDIRRAMNIHRSLRDAGMNPLLAGGAAVDSLLASVTAEDDEIFFTKPRDWDFFIPNCGISLGAMGATLAAAEALIAEGLDPAVTYSPYESSVGCVTAEDIQIVLSAESSHRHILARFDSPLCQAWMIPTDDDKRFEIRTSELFDELFERRVLGFHSDSATDSHINRLKEKFPEFLLLELAERKAEELPEEKWSF